MKILLVDDNAARAEAVQTALAQAGFPRPLLIAGTEDLPARVAEIGADVIIIDVDSPSRDVLESMREITRERPRPVVMFVDQSDEAATKEAIEAGVSAYIIAGLDPQRVKPILDVAIARFRTYMGLREELERTRASLKERKSIEKAKGILMRERGLNEDAAFKALRKLAMDKGKRIGEIADQVIAVSEILGRDS
ncbi:ANTAR domain-containing response regulator [Desertibaculum subflavum]|uniref:ANTAR domain-containing response regulator n=1 Tax=Desertibaculum subflavum TaxID=2268458 RepID=UPI000E670676